MLIFSESLTKLRTFFAFTTLASSRDATTCFGGDQPFPGVVGDGFPRARASLGVAAPG